MADKILLDFFYEEDSQIIRDEGIKKGIRELCRHYVMKGKTFFIADKRTPKFITCKSPIKDAEKEWIRIPFGNATLKQFNEMILLRKNQIKQDEKALNNLIEIYNTLNKKSYNQDKIIGDIIIEKKLSKQNHKTKEKTNEQKKV
jgi:hypothetical protein